MSRRAVYDAMIFLQWAALPSDSNRQHATVTAITSAKFRLCLSPALFDEVRGLLMRPELRERLPSLTPEHVGRILAKALEFSDWHDDPPPRFTLSAHPKDDHLFNLAIAAEAEFIVTWEERLLHLERFDASAADALRKLAPGLRIISPKEVAELIR